MSYITPSTTYTYNCLSCSVMATHVKKLPMHIFCADVELTESAEC